MERSTCPITAPTCECLGVRLTVNGSSLVIVAVYRPGSARPSAAFFDDLTTLLESVNLLGCPFVVGGDFNIHVEDPTDSDAIRLSRTLRCVRPASESPAPTRHRWCSDCCLSSDHSLIVSSLPIQPIHQTPSPRTVRNWRSMDRVAFCQAVTGSSLASVRCWCYG